MRTWKTQTGERGDRAGLRRRSIATLVAAAALAAPVAGPGARALGQEPAPPRHAEPDRCGAPWTALGIGSISCTACSIGWGRNTEPSASFGVEPEIGPTDPRVAEGDLVRRGDRLVAVDGALITTAAGVANLLGVRPGQGVVLRVRRDGRTRDLRVVAGDPCDVEPPPLPSPAPEAPLPPVAEPAPEPLPPPAALTPLPAPAAPSDLPPRARLGFAFSCSECGIREGRWFFSAPPTVTGVERDSPAWAAGFRPGDEIVAVEGRGLTSEAGQRAFGDITPGDRVRWQVRRDGALRTLVLTAEPKPTRPAPAPRPELPPRAVATGIGRAPEVADVLRYQGSVGDVDVEVRGAPVTVNVVEEDGEIVIRTSDTLIRLRKAGGG
ncbi:MAG: PDZ domain-containing protein [Gemmatimonadota bacterium]|jgi:hypothetical protein